MTKVQRPAGQGIRQARADQAGRPIKPENLNKRHRERAQALRRARRLAPAMDDLFQNIDGDRVLVTCDAPDGVFQPCRCGSIRSPSCPARGPHAAQLKCDTCGTGGRRLSRAHFEQKTTALMR